MGLERLKFLIMDRTSNSVKEYLDKNYILLDEVDSTNEFCNNGHIAPSGARQHRKTR